MSLQGQLNQAAINCLPIIKEAISAAGDFEANQMECKALSLIMNADTPVSEMSAEELELFQADMLEVFKHYNWIK